LMQQFYRELQSGKSKDEALRAAQLKLLQTRSSSHPYYWAAFSLIGDWR
jgi:CHAT domain-containing protein